MKQLTNRQKRILRFHAKWENEPYFSPTPPHPWTHYKILQKLYRRGFLNYEFHQLSPTCFTVKFFINTKGRTAIR